MRRMEDDLAATAVGRCEDEVDVCILDQTVGPCAFHGNAEVRRPLGERVWSGKESDYEWAGALTEANAATIGEGGVRTGGNNQQS